ncbi:UNKNOWN [Stylonychia lemnae]|uniref:Uncharacterized protein n=1 Tax=Stylonychia lemnae TaxID=5949 RepID=A0A078AQ78_STYLE|nr:UNKNOWN [Stylonychia lemnae]|eukprot:CDW84126.1 UNKNOWN [Stylonychia lemnae]
MELKQAKELRLFSENVGEEYIMVNNINTTLPLSLISTHPIKSKDFKNYPIGVTAYENFFTHQEMLEIEGLILQTEEQCSKNVFLPDTAQQTFSGTRLTRTKFFFGYRYMWTRQQLSEPFSQVAAGVRCDVSRPPLWVKQKLVEPFEKCKIVEKDFINSIAMNVYHDGTEGLAQHYDDATRFKQVYFLSQLSIANLYKSGYAANGVKHCIRPQDMTGKSAAMILRQMHPNVVKEADIYDRKIELPMWMSTLSIENNAKTFHSQKISEALEIIKQEEQNKKDKKNFKGLSQDDTVVQKSIKTKKLFKIDQSRQQTIESFFA